MSISKIENPLGEFKDKLQSYPEALLNARIRANFITIPQTTIKYEELYNKLKEYKQVKYLIVKLEKHEDNGLHIHIVIKLKQQVKIRIIHNLIMSVEGNINGSINYQTPKKINASIQYLKKQETEVEDAPYLEYGEAPPEPKHINNNYQSKQDIKDTALLEAIQLADNGGDIDEALEHIKQTNPRDYLLYKQQLKNTLLEDSNNKTRKKYELPDMSKENVKLTKKQEQVWELLQTTPKQRRIIWVTGQYGSGKSFLYNYIKNNHEYGMYDAGQTASLDNIAYGYDEEGVVAWDLPRTYNFIDYGDAIANVIEKFSDFGQSITSKKYNGKTQNVRGHAIVFSNHKPIEQLKHRDIIHIDLTEETEETEQTEEIVKNEEQSDISEYQDNNTNHTKKNEHQFSDSSDDEEQLPYTKIRVLKYLNQTTHLDHPLPQHRKTFQDIIQLAKYVKEHNLPNIDIPDNIRKLYKIEN